MKVMVLVKASRDSEAGVLPSAQLLEEMGKFNEELAKAGVLLAGDGLHPSSKGARVKFSDPGSVRRDRRAHCGVLAMAGELARGSDRVGQALPQPAD